MSRPDRFEGKTVLITGSAKGQGAEEARRFAAEGASVIVADVADDLGEATAAEIGPAARYVHLDVTQEASWEAALAGVDALHVLVNNAGILGPFTPIFKMELRELERTIDINLIGTFLGLKHAGKLISKSGGGAIVNISSIGGYWGIPYSSPYVASKFGVRGLTKAAAMELGRNNIRVNSVHPGGVKTDMTAAMGDDGTGGWYDRLPVPRIGTVDDVTNAVLFLASEEASYITGTELIVDGGTLAGDLSMIPPVK